ncbi:uncharacterized protein LOC116253606 isoform X2 [Nymphaea colorata]|uniref:uncharacterized protein LOC116253606 isoform X2 n=1 Tax=Nymphaea colorata TaxID=210225 RepID=UPI00129DA6B1|nr:uncharacterized protein LOC116253606 isoform X2 [Nymphaea colorata]
MALSERKELENDVVMVILPPLTENDPLYTMKKDVLFAKNIDLAFRLQFSDVSCPGKVVEVLEKIIQAARCLNLDETELYFMEDYDDGPFSFRNELESLNLVKSVINRSFLNASDDKMRLQQLLEEATMDKFNLLESNCIEEKMIRLCDSGSDMQLLEWGRKHGVKSKLQIAEFNGAGRGAFAVEDIDVGEAALEIPQSIVISEQHIYESNMFNIFKDMVGISSETMLLLWSMTERCNPASKFNTYFDTLPKDFNTGLSFGLDALAALEGTLLLEEILQAREHLRKQYDDLCPPLCARFPDIFRPELYTWDQFLWACELWYSNGMKVVFTDGQLRTCLVPIAGFLNHSLWPHILHYGKVDAETGVLKFCASRPCRRGKQCYLSYGPFSGAHFVNFYGFLPKGDNPYDLIPLDVDSSSCVDWATHMVRGTWFSKSHKLPNYGLPSNLLLHLQKAMLQCEDNLSPTDILAEKKSDIERAVLETIMSIFSSMLESLGGTCDEFDRETISWDVKLALDFKDLQKRIVSSVVESCSAALQELDDLRSKTD